jgi:hypothetical protein
MVNKRKVLKSKSKPFGVKTKGLLLSLSLSAWVLRNRRGRSNPLVFASSGGKATAKGYGNKGRVASQFSLWSNQRPR